MERVDKITGNRIYGLLEQARKKRIMLKMNILGTGHEGLTMVIGFNIKNNDERFFIIDYPSSTEKVFPVAKGEKCYFEYTGQDKIPYSFRALIAQVDNDSLTIELPDAIERIQRRKYFRINTPAGTKMILNHHGKGFEFDVINVSEGGALVGHKTRFHNKNIFYEGGLLSKLQLISREEGLATRIYIDSAEIVRIAKNSDRGRYDYAIEFNNILNQNETKIREFIYNCQRKAIKRMGYMED